MQQVLHSFVYSLDFLRELIADVPEAAMTAQPAGITNHPAWTIGHLVFISQAIGGVAGLEPWLDEQWTKDFGPDSKPSTNCGTGDYKVSLLAALDIAQTKLTDAVTDLSEEQLDAPFPDPSYSDVFPSVRHALTQVLLGHTAFHVGQLSVWRRAMNLPSPSRSYE